MSIEAIKQALLIRGLTPYQQLVLIHLANFKNPETELCCPSVKLLVELTGLSRMSVHRAISSLEKIGRISIAMRFEKTKNRIKQMSSSYTLLLCDAISDVSESQHGCTTNTQCTTDTGRGGAPQHTVKQKKELNPPDAIIVPKKTVTALTRKAYTEAFQDVYMVPPRWTVQDNSLMANFVRQIGSDVEAAAIARHYLTMGQYGIAKDKRHPIRCLLQDASGIDADMRRSGIIKTAGKSNVLPFVTNIPSDDDF